MVLCHKYRNMQYWPALPTIHRGLEWPQCLNCWPAFPEMTLGDKVASVFELFSVLCSLFVLCLIVGKFSNFLNFNVLYCTIKYYSVPKQYSAVPVRVYL